MVFFVWKFAKPMLPAESRALGVAPKANEPRLSRAGLGCGHRETGSQALGAPGTLHGEGIPDRNPCLRFRSRLLKDSSAISALSCRYSSRTGSLSGEEAEDLEGRARVAVVCHCVLLALARQMARQSRCDQGRRGGRDCYVKCRAVHSGCMGWSKGSASLAAEGKFEVSRVGLLSLMPGSG